jgi:hypothetical protein
MHILYKVTYLPHLGLGTNRPKFYIGSKYNYKGNYYGSVASKQVYEYTEGKSLKDWWKIQKLTPENLLFEVLEVFDDITPEELVNKERDLQLKLNVLSESYFNHSVATKGFCSKKRSEESIKHISNKTKQYWDSDAGQLKRQRLVERNERNKKIHSDLMIEKWKNPSDAMKEGLIKSLKTRTGVPLSAETRQKLKKIHLIEIEYRGIIYSGWDSLLQQTGVTVYLYKKYYLNGYDPEVNIGRNYNPKLIKLENT